MDARRLIEFSAWVRVTLRKNRTTDGPSTLEELAAAVGWPLSTLYGRLNGRTVPTEAHLAAIEAALIPTRAPRP